MRGHRTLIVLVGLIAAFFAGWFANRWCDAGRVNLIGPIEGRLDVMTTDGRAVDIGVTIGADVRRLALFTPYADRAIGLAAITDEVLPVPVENLDLDSLNGAITAMVAAETDDHPGLAEIAELQFDHGAMRTSSLANSWLWSGVATNTLIIGGVAAVAMICTAGMLCLNQKRLRSNARRLSVDDAPATPVTHHA